MAVAACEIFLFQQWTMEKRNETTTTTTSVKKFSYIHITLLKDKQSEKYIIKNRANQKKNGEREGERERAGEIAERKLVSMGATYESYVII